MSIRHAVKSAFIATVRRLSRAATNGPHLCRRLMVLLSDNLDTRRRVRDGDVRFSIRMTSPIEAYRADSLIGKEPETLAWLRDTLDDTALLLDVGANIGIYSLYAAALPGRGVRVLAFEPVPANLANLCRNIVDNGLSERIVPVGIALGAQSGAVEIPLSNLESGGALHGDAYVAPGAEVLTVTTAALTLDDYLARHRPSRAPTHLKIDVDGPELAVLTGARETLRAPTLRHLLVELSDQTEAEGLRLIADAGFTETGRSEQRGDSVNFLFRKVGVTGT